MKEAMIMVLKTLKKTMENNRDLYIDLALDSEEPLKTIYADLANKYVEMIDEIREKIIKLEQ